ncbi:MAG TPA: hypothetical protein DCG75_05140 [Bacteroidales bacterium]|jgi:hypothetical protein|nr:hypothetical protein [Bacteroidales bacterium]
MNTKTKKSLLIGSIILLIVINISALSTIYYKSKILPKKNIELNKMKEEVHIRGMHRFIKEQLNLSESQFIKFQEISNINMTNSQKIMSKLNDKRLEMINEIAKKNPNTEILDRIAHEIGDLHYELKKSTINHFLQLKDICNEEQQEDLQKLFMHMIHDQDTDHRMMDRGPREKGRNRYGRPHRNS